MENAVEQLLCEILGNLFSCTNQQLVIICNQLNVEEPGEKAKLNYVAAIKDSITKQEIKDMLDGGLSYYYQVRAVIKVNSDDSKEEEMTKKMVALEEEMAQRVKQLEKQLDITTKAAWKKDLRIAGSIGESGQKDKLTFTSLARQMESAVKEGRSEEDIVEAVLKAISPGLRLRSYLEGTDNLTLGKLRRLLRAHYQERDATALFHDLSGAAQMSAETPQQYLVRLLDLRQKIIFASQEDNSGLVYDQGLVQKMLTKSFCTGLRDSSIRTKMEGLLTEGKVSDETLMERLNVAVATEAEVEQKRATMGRRSAKVQEVNVEQAPVTSQPQSNKTSNKDNLKTSILKELKEDIQTFLKAEVNAAFAQQQQMHMQASPHQAFPQQQQMQAPLHQAFTQQQQMQAPPRQRQQRQIRPRGCTNCQEKGVGDSCQHCFKCGSKDHYARGCRKASQSGNGQRLQTRGHLQPPRQ